MPTRTYYTFKRVAATLRLRNLHETFIYPLDDEKRRLKPATTIRYNMMLLNLFIRKF